MNEKELDILKMNKDPIIGSWKSPVTDYKNRYRIFQFNADGGVTQTLFSSDGTVIESFSDAEWKKINDTTYHVCRHSKELENLIIQMLGNAMPDESIVTDEFVLQEEKLLLQSDDGVQVWERN